MVKIIIAMAVRISDCISFNKIKKVEVNNA